MNDPITPEDWQAAADAADFLLLVDSAQQYGLITGGEGVNVDRCHELLSGAADRGIFPSSLDGRRRWVGWWLREARSEAGVTQRRIAAHIGASQSYVSAAERGAVDVGDAMLGRLRSAIEQIRKEKKPE